MYTFTREKLIEYHNIEISEETVRKWMMEKHLWIPRQRKLSIHPSRPRRNYFGEMIQIDASHHRWLEDRAEKCALIVFIDDSTSKLTNLFFCPVESFEGYFVALRNHVLKYGRPISLYSDRHAIFGGSSRIRHAQFIRALKESMASIAGPALTTIRQWLLKMGQPTAIISDAGSELKKGIRLFSEGSDVIHLYTIRLENAFLTIQKTRLWLVYEFFNKYRGGIVYRCVIA